MDKIAVEGYDPEYGARPLRRAIQKHIEDRLSEELLKGTVLTGQNVIIDVVDGEFVISSSAAHRNPSCKIKMSSIRYES